MTPEDLLEEARRAAGRGDDAKACRLAREAAAAALRLRGARCEGSLPRALETLPGVPREVAWAAHVLEPHHPRAAGRGYGEASLGGHGLVCVRAAEVVVRWAAGSSS